MLNNPSNLHQALMPPDVPGHFWDLGVHPESLQHPDSRTASKPSRYHGHVVHTRPYYWTRHGLRDLSRLAPPGPSIPEDREPPTKSSVYPFYYHRDPVLGHVGVQDVPRDRRSPVRAGTRCCRPRSSRCLRREGVERIKRVQYRCYICVNEVQDTH